MTKRELIEALEALDCSDEVEVVYLDTQNGCCTIFTVKEVKIKGTGIVSHIEVS